MITGKDDGRKGGREEERGREIKKKKKKNKNGKEVNMESQAVMELSFYSHLIKP